MEKSELLRMQENAGKVVENNRELQRRLNVSLADAAFVRADRERQRAAEAAEPEAEAAAEAEGDAAGDAEGDAAGDADVEPPIIQSDRGEFEVVSSGRGGWIIFQTVNGIKRKFHKHGQNKNDGTWRYNWRPEPATCYGKGL